MERGTTERNCVSILLIALPAIYQPPLGPAIMEEVILKKGDGLFTRTLQNEVTACKPERSEKPQPDRNIPNRLEFSAGIVPAFT